MQELKDIILKNFKDEHTRTGKVQSVRSLYKKFQSRGLNNRNFYKLFPGGLTELCQLTGAPKPKDRFRRIEKAAKARETLREERQNTRMGDVEWFDLQQRKAKYEAKKREIDEKTRLREEVRHLALDLASTPEGREEIFRDPQALQEFCETTLPHLNNDSDILQQFESFCDKNKLSYEETLFLAVGALEVYKLNCSLGHIPLDKYVVEQVTWFMRDYETEEKQKVLQKKFEASLMNAKCQSCGDSFAEPFYLNGKYLGHTMLIVKGSLRCNNCNAFCELHCPGCGDQLDYGEAHSLHCSSCDVTLTIPHERLHVD